MVTQKLIPIAAMERILKKSGADRVSEKAKSALKTVVEEIAERLAEKAVRLAQHTGRKTVKESDIKLATKS